MARILANTPDVQAPDADYLKGRILDQDNSAAPPIPGTPIVERLYGDIVEFFQKLMSLAEIAENDLPDNETNGHQYINALNDFVSDRLPSLTGKADKVTGATNGNLAGLDASGNLTDSGTDPSDFDAAGAASTVQGNLNTLAGTLGTASTKNTGMLTGNILPVLSGDIGESGVVMIDEGPGTSYVAAVGNAFNKSFGTGVGTVCQGNDSRITNILSTAPIEIGDWDMDADSTKTVSHALGISIDKIIGAEAWIKNDSNTSRTLLGVSDGDRISVLVDTIVLERALSGFFDTAGYDQTSFNRGWVIIKYIL